MKKVFSFLLAVLIGLLAFGQQNSGLKVAYDVKATSMFPKKKAPSMTLLTDGYVSMYYNEMTLYVDSMESTAEGKAKLRDIQMKAWMSVGPDGVVNVNMDRGGAPSRKTSTYVLKDFAKGNISHYDKWGGENGKYDEAVTEQQWEIVGDSTRTILGYECVMARMPYHGREWKAWFAPEIPASDGPWKFCGLPGLILRAESADGLYSFEATAIENADATLPPMYAENNYDKVKRTEAVKSEEYYHNNYESVVRAKYGTDVKIVGYRDDDGNEIERPKFVKELHAIETDY